MVVKFGSFDEFFEELHSRVNSGGFVAGTVSQPRAKSSDVKRVRMKLVSLGKIVHVQFEYQVGDQVKHENLPVGLIRDELYRLACEYRQFQLQTVDADIHVVLSKKYKVLWREDVLDVPREQVLGHNRKKRYILDDDVVHPFLVRLGVQAEDGLIRQKYYDKFRQINRFLEFVEDSLEYLPRDRTVRILDFGSGKSYLTFALYYYLHVVKEFDVRITGLDLKEEVILQCQAIARDLGYDDGLDFVVGNIHDYDGVDSADMVVTLHACDVATDMALAQAVRWGRGSF